jgi:fatty acid desaturase
MSNSQTTMHGWAAAGYLSVFITPSLVVVGIESHKPLLALAAVMLLYPLLRLLFGEVGARNVDWPESVATALDKLPLVLAAVLIAVVVWMPWRLQQALPLHAAFMVSAGLSLWITLLLGTCAAHDLIHRRAHGQARMGRWLAAVSGYPLLPFEHLVHHRRPGDIARAEWAAATESVWTFAARRGRLILHAAWQCARQHQGSATERAALLEACAITALTACMYTVALGWPGFLLYLCVAVGVGFGFQAITYLQHWGLGSDTHADENAPATAWEDSCRFQAWVTFNVSFHQAHHTQSQRPYYQLSLEQGAPRQPAGYVILLVLCMVPALWRKLMLPVLDAWRREPMAAPPAGRRLTCFHWPGKTLPQGDTS